MAVLDSVPVGRLPLERFETVLAPERYEAVRAAAGRARERLEGRVVWNLNSTARGGGVAEMLVSLLAYAHGAGVDARWIVIGGNDPFFALTKRIHNNLHSAPGDGGDLGDAEREIYESALQPNIEEFAALVDPRDVVIVHDPQPAGLIPRLDLESTRGPPADRVAGGTARRSDDPHERRHARVPDLRRPRHSARPGAHTARAARVPVLRSHRTRARLPVARGARPPGAGGRTRALRGPHGGVGEWRRAHSPLER